MRFSKTIPKYGNHRTVTKFCLFPVSMYTRHETKATEKTTRWLETATWEEVWTRGRGADFWNKVRWIDND